MIPCDSYAVSVKKAPLHSCPINVLLYKQVNMNRDDYYIFTKLGSMLGLTSKEQLSQ